MEIETLRAEIGKLKGLLAEKEGLLYRAEQKMVAADNAAIALALQVTKSPLICSLCGVKVSHPPAVGALHQGCFTTGYWAKGFRTHNDWIRDCIRNGASVEEFYSKKRGEKILTSNQENGETPNKAET